MKSLLCCVFAILTGSVITAFAVPNEAPGRFELVSPARDIAKKTEDLDNPVYTGRIDYPAAPQILSDAATQVKYSDQFQEAWRWWRLIFSAEFLPDEEKALMGAVPNGTTDDDLIVARYAIPEGDVQIIDGRSITMAFRVNDPSHFIAPEFRPRWLLDDWGNSIESPDRTNIPQKTPESDNAVKPAGDLSRQSQLENFVHSVFRRAFRFDERRESRLVVTRIQTEKFSEALGGYGVILSGDGTSGWIMDGAITWWSNGRDVVFDVRKLIKPNDSKIFPKGRPYAFGIPFNDARKFRRFPSSDIDFTEVLRQSFRDEKIARFIVKPTHVPLNKSLAIKIPELDSPGDGPDKIIQ